MGKVGRFACILTPMLLTLASLICIVLVVIGQTPWKGNNAPSTALGRDLYFFKADTSGFNADPQNVIDHLPDSVKPDTDLVKALQGAASSKELKDFYQVGLWSYCEGDKDKDGKETITHCSSRKFSFWFDPFSVWELKDTSAQKALGDDMQKVLNAYKKAAGFMNWAFVITLILSAVEFVIGFFAIFSRWGSLVTTIVSTAQTIFALAAATTATAIYAALVGVFKSVLKPYDIDASMGTKMLTVLWLGVAFSVASGFFWLISVCCCSGKSPHKKVVVEKTPYTYERVASPAFGGQQAQHTGYAGAAGHGTSGTAYEPFRQQQHV
ncbi:integral membrane protein-like protein [Cucurbitaria berberidis CBS 394.84]|uniref:Integral membrane protein-like protein n=1 Tax=Cucurbitaria berberidis CBS 394.84 TaxID=1168544 RepID=A0A9P4L4P4_9PLEO|nr:integral membrane protein-like protein [Cucurbitaria berberidis CBS 394.84]KAF1841730.1 integral membrane protein-like protein [Cucurbitaria berberidis CBS 394.84]